MFSKPVLASCEFLPSGKEGGLFMQGVYSEVLDQNKKTT